MTLIIEMPKKKLINFGMLVEGECFIAWDKLYQKMRGSNAYEFKSHSIKVFGPGTTIEPRDVQISVR